MVFLQGMKILALKILWSVIMSIVSCLLEGGSLVMKSIAIVWKGRSLVGIMGNSGGLVRCMLTLFIWQVAHLLT